MTATPTTTTAGSLADRARDAYHAKHRQAAQDDARNLATWQQEVRDAAAAQASRVLGYPPTSPSPVAPARWTIHDPDHPDYCDWQATATVDGLRLVARYANGRQRLYLAEDCPGCGSADSRRSPVTSLADLGAALAAAADPTLSWPWECQTCADRAATHAARAEAELAAEQDARPATPTPPPRDTCRRWAAEAAETARGCSSEAAVLIEAATSIAYSLLALTDPDRPGGGR